jgi:hypothetical protein
LRWYFSSVWRQASDLALWSRSRRRYRANTNNIRCINALRVWRTTPWHQFTPPPPTIHPAHHPSHPRRVQYSILHAYFFFSWDSTYLPPYNSCNFEYWCGCDVGRVRRNKFLFFHAPLLNRQKNRCTTYDAIWRTPYIPAFVIICIHKFFCQVWFLFYPGHWCQSSCQLILKRFFLVCYVRVAEIQARRPIDFEFSSRRIWVLFILYFLFSLFFFFFYLCSNPDFYKIPSFELKKKIKSRSSRNVQVACVLLSPNMWTSIPSFAPASPYSNAHSMYAKWSGLPACEEETTYRAD